MDSGVTPKRRKPGVNVPLLTGGIILGTVIVAVLLVLVVWLTPNPLSDALKAPLYWRHETAGKRRVQERDYRSAEREYAAMIRLRPDLPYGYFLHGTVALRQRRYQDAITDFSGGLRQRPTPEERGSLKLYLAMAYEGANRYREAIALTDELLRDHEGDPARVYRIRGDVEGRGGDYRHAASDLARATELDPSAAGDWGNRGWWEYEAGMLPQSVQSSRKSLSLRPSRVNVRFNLGLAYLVLGREADARAAYMAALKTASEGERAAAMKDLREAISRYPASTPLLRQAMEWIRAAPPAAPTGAADPAP